MSHDFSIDDRHELLDTLYNQPRSLATSAFSTAVIGWICWSQTGHAWYLEWAFTGWLLLGLRLGLTLMYRRRRQWLSVDDWAKLFFCGAIASALLIGVGTSLTILRSDCMVANLYMATNAISFAGGAAVRNSASPLAARGQTLVALGLPGLACLICGVPQLRAFAFLTLVHLVAQLEISQVLGRRTQRLLIAKREQAALNVRLGVTCDQLALANSALQRLSFTDGLTELANRRAFDEVLQKEWDRVCSKEIVIALLMVDVDHFKRFNDLHGHLSGDEALRSVAQSIRSALVRSCDSAYRFGGEEFAVLIPDAEIGGALETAERIRCAIAGVPPAHATSNEKLTVSVGVALLRPKLGEKSVRLVSLADSALYVAKQNGRNRTEVAETNAYKEETLSHPAARSRQPLSCLSGSAQPLGISG